MLHIRWAHNLRSFSESRFTCKSILLYFHGIDFVDDSCAAPPLRTNMGCRPGLHSLINTFRHFYFKLNISMCADTKPFFNFTRMLLCTSTSLHTSVIFSWRTTACDITLSSHASPPIFHTPVAYIMVRVRTTRDITHSRTMRDLPHSCAQRWT